MTLPGCRASTTEMKPVWRATPILTTAALILGAARTKLSSIGTRNSIWLRKDYDVIREGDFDPFSIGDDVLGFRTRTARRDHCLREAGTGSRISRSVCRCVCRAPALTDHPTASTDVKAASPLAAEQGSSSRVALRRKGDAGLARSSGHSQASGRQSVLHPASRVEASHNTRSLNAAAESCSTSRRCPPVGSVTWGKDAYRYVDFLAESGQRLWQILPLNPVGPGNSPYRSPSAMAGNPLLISPDLMLEEGLLTQEEVRKELGRLSARYRNPRRVGYPLVREVKERLFRQA